MVDMAHFAGLVAGGAHPSPFPHAHVVTSTTHKTLRGPRGGFVLTNDEELARKINSAVFPGSQSGPLMHVIAAKAVAFGEALRPSVRSYAKAVLENAKALAHILKARGVGIVAGTSGGFGVAEFRQVGELIAEVLDALSRSGAAEDVVTEAAVRDKVKRLVARFPIYNV